MMAPTLMAPVGNASAASGLLPLGGTFECTGRSLGKSSVKINCVRKVTRGNRIYTGVARFTVTGPVARLYVGKHKDCVLISAEETRFEQDIITCPGIPEWWK